MSTSRIEIMSYLTKMSSTNDADDFEIRDGWTGISKPCNIIFVFIILKMEECSYMMEITMNHE